MQMSELFRANYEASLDRHFSVDLLGRELQRSAKFDNISRRRIVALAVSLHV